MPASKAEILSARPPRFVEVSIPWYCPLPIRVAEMTGAARDAWEFENARGARDGTLGLTDNFRARLLVRCIIDGDGHRIFTDEEATRLGEEPASVLAEIFEAARKLNGLGQDEIEELEKN